jgi:PAS domain S-box-containing protein
MPKPPLPPNESARLDALRQYDALNLAGDPILNDLVSVAAFVCRAPIAFIGFIDSDRQLIRASIGPLPMELARDTAVCSYTILQSQVVYIRNLQNDPRCASNPLVTGGPQVRSYAGAPLITPDGFAIGTLAVMDQNPLNLDSNQKDVLRVLSRQAIAHLELRRNVRELATVVAGRERAEDELRQNKNQLQVVAANAPIILFALDADGQFTLAEGKGLQALGLRPGDLVGKSAFDVYANEPQMLKYLRASLAGQTTEFVVEWQGMVFDMRHSPLRDSDGRVIGVIGVATDITERKRAEDALKENEQRYRQLFASAQRQAQEQTLLDKVRSTLAREIDLSTLFHTVVEAIAETFGYTLVSLYTRRGDKIYLQHQVGYPGPTITEIPLARGISGRVMRTGKPILLRDVKSDPEFLAAIEGIISEICVPLLEQNETVGILNVESTDGVELTDSDLQLMLALSDHINIAIGRARLYDEARRRSRLLAALHETTLDLINRLELNDLLSAIVRRAAQMLDSEAGFISLVEPDGAEMEVKVALGASVKYIGLRHKAGEGMAGMVWQTGEPLVIDDYSSWPGRLPQITESNAFAVAVVPLKSGSQVFGALGITFIDVARKFGENELDLLSRFGQLASIAIDNARLYSSAQLEIAERTKIEAAVHRQNAFLAVLYETTLGLMNRLELSGLLETIILRAAELASTQHGFIYLLDPSGRELEMKLAIGVHSQHIGARLQMGQGLAGAVWQTGQPLVIDDYRTWSRRAAVFAGSDIHAVAGFPLKSGAQVVGVLGVSYPEEGQHFAQDEVDNLERFAQLASIALDNARLFTTAQRELAERKRTEQALAAANAELEQALMNARELAIASQAANRTKGEFLANMSHEIRTPLSAVIGYTDLMLGTTLTPEQREYMDQVRVSGESLLAIVTAVLDFSKLEAGRFDLEHNEFNLPDMVRQAVHTVLPTALAKHLEVFIDSNPDTPRIVVGDGARLRQVLLNLLSNAVKFTDQGRVVVCVETKKRIDNKAVLQFLVSDTGIGVPHEKLKAIFEPFTQVDGSVTRRYGGTGLGLAIARQLVEMFEGQIWVESEPGRGSIFRFTAVVGLPTRAEAVQSIEPKLSAEPATELRRPLRILLAEDNVVNQRVIARMLEKLGWEVAVVGDGNAAVAKSGEVDYDLILMDVQMPELDGLSATIAIRARERQVGGHVPIVALTAYAMQGDRERCLMAGMDDYLPKPVRAEDLQKIMSRFISLSTPG